MKCLKCKSIEWSSNLVKLPLGCNLDEKKMQIQTRLSDPIWFFGWFLFHQIWLSTYLFFLVRIINCIELYTLCTVLSTISCKWLHAKSTTNSYNYFRHLHYARKGMQEVEKQMERWEMFTCGNLGLKWYLNSFNREDSHGL